MTETAPAPTTHTLRTSEAELVYDVRGDLGAATADRPALLAVGTPMDARGFATLAGQFADRPVITYDPRNVGRSRRHDPDRTPTPEDHAADLHALITELGVGPVDVFGSSGGAINALALAAAHPEDLRTVVAHEPPAGGALPDADAVRAACRAVHARYQRAGSGVGMASFILLVSHQGPFPTDWADGPDPDPAMFGMPAGDDGRRDDPLMANMLTIPVWAPDVDRLRTAGCRVVLGVGAESGETLAARAPRAIAEQTGRDLVVFPGDHTGFAGGEFGQVGEPDAFAARLHEVLDR